MKQFDYAKMKKFIDKSGIKQKVIAEKAGISEAKFCMILQGQRRCEAGELASICEVLGTTMENFIKTKNR